MEKTYCPRMKRQTTRFHRDFEHLHLCLLLLNDMKWRERIYILHNAIFTVPYPLRSWDIHAYAWSLTERVIHWLRHFSFCPLLLMCSVHLSHQMCLCAASNSRCTQCWNALEKYIQRLDRALALSQHSEVGMATAVQSSPRPLLPHQPPSLFKNVPCLPYIGSCHHR